MYIAPSIDTLDIRAMAEVRSHCFDTRAELIITDQGLGMKRPRVLAPKRVRRRYTRVSRLYIPRQNSCAMLIRLLPGLWKPVLSLEREANSTSTIITRLRLGRVPHH